MTTPSLFDPPQPDEPGVKLRRDAADTSRAAALKALPRSGTARARVLAALRSSPTGLTDEELQASLRMPPNTERPRRVELVDGGWVRDSGRRRPTVWGNPSVVWEAC